MGDGLAARLVAAGGEGRARRRRAATWEMTPAALRASIARCTGALGDADVGADRRSAAAAPSQPASGSANPEAAPRAERFGQGDDRRAVPRERGQVAVGEVAPARPLVLFVETVNASSTSSASGCAARRSAAIRLVTPGAMPAFMTTVPRALGGCSCRRRPASRGHRGDVDQHAAAVEHEPLGSKPAVGDRVDDEVDFRDRGCDGLGLVEVDVPEVRALVGTATASQDLPARAGRRRDQQRSEHALGADDEHSTVCDVR